MAGGGGNPDTIQCLALIISIILLFISLYKVLTSIFEISSPFFNCIINPGACPEAFWTYRLCVE